MNKIVEGGSDDVMGEDWRQEADSLPPPGSYRTFILHPLIRVRFVILCPMPRRLI